MQVSYRRNINSSYLIVHEKQDLSPLSYDQKMVLENRIPGLLVCQRMKLDTEYEYLFEISRLQSLEFFCRMDGLNKAVLETLMESICELQEQMERYLLKEKNICYDAEYIFIEPETGKAKFCYLVQPDAESNGTMLELLEYLLTRINHKDMEITAYMYELYECASADTFCLSQWIKQKKSVLVSQMGEDENVCITERSWEDAGEFVSEQPEERLFHTERWYNAEAGWSRVKDWLRKKFVLKTEEEKENYFFEPGEEEENGIQQTVFFSKESEKIGILRPRNQEYPVLSPNGPAFIIGKRKEYAEGIVEDYTISRIHAVIYNEKNQYSVEDLNSTNGTFVNGEMLQLKQRKQLKEGDCIRFGRIEYVFEWEFH